MKKIGIDKRDPNYRHFTYDDSEILTSDPPKYKVVYEDDENDIDYVECSYVICIKTIDDGIVVTNKKPDVEIKSEKVEKVEKVVKEPKPVKKQVVVEEPKKKQTRKKKTENVIEVEAVSVDETTIRNSFKYKVIEYEFTQVDELEKYLNELGVDGWELCGFNIYKKGLFTSNYIMGIIKRKG